MKLEVGTSEELKLLFEDLHKNELSKVGKRNLELEIRNLIKQLQTYKDKEDKLREYIKYHTDGGLWHIRGSEDVVKDVVENDILDILGENNND